MDSVKLYRLGIRVLPHLPESVLYACCDVGGVLGLAATSLRQNVMANLRHIAPNLSRLQRLNVARQVIGYVLRHYVDLLRMPTMSRHDIIQRFETSGLDHLEHLATTGGLIVVPHSGSFSPVLASLAARGLPIVLVVEPIEPPEMLALVSQLRAIHGVEVITLGPQAGREMLKALRAKKMIVLAGDRDLANQSVQTLFFGATADVPSGPARLALRGIPTLTGFAGWFGANQAFFRADPVQMYHKNPDESDEAALQRITTTLIQQLERYIAEFPASWGVLQRVWVDNDHAI